MILRFVVNHRWVWGWVEQWRRRNLPPGWHRLYRHDRQIWENVCPHGIGHVAPESIREDGDGIHGCDGCCSKLRVIPASV